MKVLSLDPNDFKIEEGVITVMHTGMYIHTTFSTTTTTTVLQLVLQNTIYQIFKDMQVSFWVLVDAKYQSTSLGIWAPPAHIMGIAQLTS